MPDWVMQLVGMAGTAAAVYAGIKTDIAKAIAKAEMAEALADAANRSADQAHQRIDQIITRH